MSDLISRKALIETIRKYGICGSGYSDEERINDVIDMIESEPPVEPQKGEWKKYGNLYFDYECSLCGRLSEFDTPFCQHCGARMKV